MIGKTFRVVGLTVSYLCMGTVLAQLVLLTYSVTSGLINDDKVAKIVAVLQGTDLDAMRAALIAEREQMNPTQVSLDDVARARATQSRDLELREQSLRSSLSQWRGDQEKLATENNRYKLVKDSFETQLAQLREAELAAGQENTRQILENIKPTQAKEQLLLMIADGQMDEAVLLLATMPIAKRAKLVGEFKTDQEAIQLAEMLRLLREGEPELTVIDETETQLQPTPAP